MAKRIDPSEIPSVVGTFYPAPYDEPCRTRERKKLGDAAGLTQYGINLLRLPPGAWSSQRHWHTRSDEFVYVLEGEVALVTNQGEETLRVGDAAGFKAGEEDGHCLRNNSTDDALILEVGARADSDIGHFSEADLLAPAGGKPAIFTHKDGNLYPDAKRKGPHDD
jgi:uncharacterized cupin superfamily protein